MKKQERGVAWLMSKSTPTALSQRLIAVVGVQIWTHSNGSARWSTGTYIGAKETDRAASDMTAMLTREGFSIAAGPVVFEWQQGDSPEKVRENIMHITGMQ